MRMVILAATVGALLVLATACGDAPQSKKTPRSQSGQVMDSPPADPPVAEDDTAAPPSDETAEQARRAMRDAVEQGAWGAVYDRLAASTRASFAAQVAPLQDPNQVDERVTAALDLTPGQLAGLSPRDLFIHIYEHGPPVLRDSLRQDLAAPVLHVSQTDSNAILTVDVGGRLTEKRFFRKEDGQWRAVIPIADYGEEELFDTEHAAPWICTETGEIFMLTPGQFEQWRVTPGKQRPHGDWTPRVVVFRNDETGRYTIVRARRSPFNGELYAPVLPDGTRQRAPGEPPPSESDAPSPPVW